MKASASEHELLVSKALDVLQSLDRRAIVPLFILKFLSDLSQERAELGESAVKLWKPAWASLMIPDTCSWDTMRRFSWRPDCANLIDAVLLSIEQSNQEVLRGVFDDLRLERMARHSSGGIESLGRALDLMSALDLRPSRGVVAGDLFEELLIRCGQADADYYVPKELATLMAHVLDPGPKESILDPVCGSGMLLSRLAKQAGSDHSVVLGQEKNASQWSLCQLNLLVHGISGNYVQLGDALREPLMGKAGELLRADIVVSNPPFGLTGWGVEELRRDRWGRFRRGLPPRGRADYAFLSHMVEVARDKKGRVAAVVSLGALTRKDELEIRRAFVEENLIAGVVSMPSNLFATTRIQVAVLFFHKGKSTQDVIFIDASRSFEAAGRINRLTDSGIGRIVATLKSMETVAGFSRRVSIQEIREKGYQLSVSRYVESERPELALQDADQMLSEIEKIEGELSAVRSEIEDTLRELGLGFG